jgi:hypothetical protein
MFFTKLTDRIKGLVSHCIKKSCKVHSVFKSDGKPPIVAAVVVYDVLTDETKWYECDDPLLLREMPDYDLNRAAARLVNEHLEQISKIGWGE